MPKRRSPALLALALVGCGGADTSTLTMTGDSSPNSSPMCIIGDMAYSCDSWAWVTFDPATQPVDGGITPSVSYACSYGCALGGCGIPDEAGIIHDVGRCSP